MLNQTDEADSARAFIRRSRQVFGKMWQPVLWTIALSIGLVVGYATIGFRMLIAGTQWAAFGTPYQQLYSTAQTLPWWQLLLLPTFGGLIIGLLLEVVRFV